MARAGYNPRAALALWGLLNEIEQDQHDRGEVAWADKIPWTRTHPTGKDREQVHNVYLSTFLKVVSFTLLTFCDSQQAIQKALPKAMKAYRTPLAPAVAAQSTSTKPIEVKKTTSPTRQL